MTSEQPVCLVLTCNRPYYKKRRSDNHATFKILADAGFRIFFLLADSNIEKTVYSVDEDLSYDTITVPCPDSYDYLTKKIYLAFAELKDKVGILKIDDDIQINDLSCLTELKKIITVTDYFGIADVFKEKGSHNNVKDGMKFSPMFNHLTAFIPKDFTYYGGPFYWVSRNSLQKIAIEGLEFPWEDLAVGYAVSKYPRLKTLYLPWKSEHRITWYNETETTGISPQVPLKSYCFISVEGRLGNHMFQIAALVRHCLVYNKIIKIFVTNNHKYYDGSLYKCKQFITANPVKNNAARPPFHYVPIDENATVLNGYFQSSRYFADISGSIRAIFDPHPVIKNVVTKKYGPYLTEEVIANTVIVHVRRGDYMSATNARIHGILTPLYYRRAMSILQQHLGPSTQFLLFSDDFNYCCETYSSDPAVTCIDEPNEAIALHFMSQFRHYIISNSSFSWWATYLGEKATTVIGPNRWFGPGGPQDFQDVYEPGWNLIKAE